MAACPASRSGWLTAWMLGADNYLVLLSHVTRQGVVGAADVRTYLGIDEEYEDVDAA